MKKLKKHMIYGIAIAFLPVMTGCGTMYAYQHNQSAAIREYAYRSGDPEVIKAYKNNDVHGIGINITAVDTVFRSPGSVGVQLLGAVVDVLTFYGISEAADSINDSGDSSSTSAGRDATVINNTGNGNSVEIINSQGSSVTPPTPIAP